LIETIISGIIALGVLVFAHELGHFLAAKKSGIRVEQFSIGFWPRVFGVTRGGTDYRISAIPFGGYVKMAGMSYEDEDRTGAEDEFLSKPAWVRAFVAVAGPAMNFILAAILCAAMGLIGYTIEDYPAVLGKVDSGSTASSLGLQEGDELLEVDGTPVSTWYGFADVVDEAGTQREVEVKIVRGEEALTMGLGIDDLREVLAQTPPRNPPVVGQVLIGYPAYRAGLTVGDSIVAVNGQDVNDWSDLQESISSSPDTPVNFDIVRGEGRFSVEIVPMAVRQRSGESEGRIGISPVQVSRYAMKLPLVESLKQGPVTAARLAGQIYKNLWTLVTNITTLSKSLVGPIGIVQMTGGEARKGLANYLYWGAFVSVALMVFNLLPIPVLDGGHIFLSGIEGLVRRRLKPRVHILVHRVGMGLLGALVVFVVLNDLHRLWSRDRAVSRTETEAVETGEGAAPEAGQ
jgi:regulator of sigma E protease